MFIRMQGMERDVHTTRPENCCQVAISPPTLPSGEMDQTLAIFKALADRTRFEIVRLIAAQEAPICACDIVDRFDVSQPTIAHHLKVLREAGLITASRQGVWAYYEVNPRGVKVLESVAAGLSRSYQATAAD